MVTVSHIETEAIGNVSHEANIGPLPGGKTSLDASGSLSVGDFRLCAGGGGGSDGGADLNYDTITLIMKTVFLMFIFRGKRNRLLILARGLWQQDGIQTCFWKRCILPTRW